MRILSLSNFYPPHAQGGYELWCREVTERLRGLGHDAAVLTSRWRSRVRSEPDPAWVHRDLHLEMEFASLANGLRFFTSRRRREQANGERLARLVDTFAPDRILIWGMWNLPRSLPALAERLRPGRVAYYMGDYWPTLPSQHVPYWRSPARSWWAAGVKAPLRVVALRRLACEPPPPLRFTHAMFASTFLRDELSRRGAVSTFPRVIYGGIETAPFVPSDTHPAARRELRLLWVGRLVEEKGPDLAIRAFAEVVHAHGLTDLRLQIVGAGEPRFVAQLTRLAAESGVGERVDLVGAHPVEALPAFYQQADIFLFTSRWPEPFGRTIVEAMACGVAVAGAPVGGAAEILVDDRNALTFEPGNARSLATIIARLATDADLRRRLGTRAREDVLAAFDLQRMTTDIEHYLEDMAGGHAA